MRRAKDSPENLCCVGYATSVPGLEADPVNGVNIPVDLNMPENDSLTSFSLQ